MAYIDTTNIPLETKAALEKEGFCCRGKNGSFYKKENGFTYRIATHKKSVPDGNIVLTILYSSIEELKKIKTSKFRKLVRKYLAKKRKLKEREDKKYKRKNVKGNKGGMKYV